MDGFGGFGAGEVHGSFTNLHGYVFCVNHHRLISPLSSRQNLKVYHSHRPYF